MSSIFGAFAGASLGTLFVRLTADATELVTGMNQAVTTIEFSAKSILAIIKNIAVGVAAVMAVIGVVSVREAMKFEDSFAGVRKTVQATEVEYAKMAQAFRNLAKEIPTNVNEINRVAEAAGQLGIANENIVSFTKVMVMLGTTTNMSSDEAASALARFANITQMSQKDFDRLGATLVALGYNSASTEKEIADMALRIAGAGHQIGMSNAEILSFAAGLSSVGIQAEMGGSAISQLMIRMAEAVATGGAKLETFAGIAGMTGERFRTAFKQHAAESVLKFVEGLHEVSKAGGDVFAVLDGLGIDGIRMTDLLLRASGAGDLFRQTMEVGNKAWEDNTALVEAAEKRYTTFSSQLTITWNIIKDLLISIGQQLLPVLKLLNTMLQDVMKSQDGTNSMMSTFIKKIGPAFVVAVGLIGDAFWAWRLLNQTIQYEVLRMFDGLLKAAKIFAAFFAAIIEKLANNMVASINFAIQTANKLLPSSKQLPTISWKLKLDLSGVDTEIKGLDAAVKQSRDNLLETWQEGSFSMRLIKEYKKATKAVEDANAKMAEDTKKTMDAMKAPADFNPSSHTSKEEIDSSDAMRKMALMKMPEEALGDIKGLRGMEDPNMREMRILEKEIEGTRANLKILEELNNKDLELTDEVLAKKLAMQEAYNNKLRLLQSAQAQIILGATTKMFDDLANIAANTAGKQSAVYKTMFAMSKAFAIAEAIIKIQQGIANAASMPFPSNLVAIGSVVAATSSIISTIQATRLEFGGGKAMGGDVRPGQYYKVGEQGEELFTPTQNGRIISNNELGGHQDVKVIINNYTDAQSQVTERDENGSRVIEVMIKRVKTELATEIRDSRGDMTKALENTYGLRRGK